MSPAELQAVHEMIDSAARPSAAEIYRRLNLGRYCGLRTLRRYVDARRARTAAGGASPAPRSSASGSSAQGPSRSDTLHLCLQQLYQKLLTGEEKVYAINGAIRALVDLAELDIKREADTRARDLHELKLRQLRAAVEEASTDAEGREKRLSRGEVYDLIDAVMRGEA